MPEGERPPNPASHERRWVALVADEALDFRAQLAATIHKLDPTIRVIGASTGIETRNHLLRYRPQLALINLQLPGMTGAEALAWALARQVRSFSVVMSSAVLQNGSSSRSSSTPTSSCASPSIRHMWRTCWRRSGA